MSQMELSKNTIKYLLCAAFCLVGCVGLMVAVSPAQQVFYALVFFALLIGFLFSLLLGLYALYSLKIPSSIIRRRSFIVAIAATLIVMIQSTGRLSLTDVLLVLVLMLVSLFYAEWRFSGQ